MTAYSETRRQIVHIAMVGFALALRWLAWWQAALLTLAALGFNAMVLPHVGGQRLYRPPEVARGAALGILFYPFAVLLLILALPDRLDLVAAAWAILALGDGVATIAGRAIGGRPLPWNPDKTWAGFCAFVLAGGTGAVALEWWTSAAISPMPPWSFVLFAPILAAIVAGLVETVPVRLDDNLAVPFAAALVLWAASQMSLESWSANQAVVLSRLVPAVIINGVMGAAAYAAGSMTIPGAVAGALLGTAIYVGAGFAGWTMLFIAFAAATVSSKLGWQRKSLLGIAEERGGRRGAGNAVANVLVAAAAGVLAVAAPERELARLALVVALTAGASDTVASEIGKAWGRRTFLVIGFEPVRPGTSGAMSLEGTAAGVAAAFAMGAAAAALGLVPYSAVWVVAVAATIGALVESALGATFESSGVLNNDWLNFLNTAVAAAVALLIWRPAA